MLLTSSEVSNLRFLVHLAFLGWLWRLSSFSDGSGFVTIAWGVYGVILLVAGLRRDLIQLRITGLGTPLLVVAKLLRKPTSKPPRRLD